MTVRKLFTGASRGFTLIELLVVMGIIGILATLMFTNFSGARERTRDAKRKNDLNQVKSALRLYYNDNQKYPADGGGSDQIYGCGNGTQVCNWGSSSFTANGTVYMNQLPQDPISDAGVPSYEYAVGSPLDATDNSFTLTAILENESDTSAAESQEKCGVASGSVVDNVYMVCAD